MSLTALGIGTLADHASMLAPNGVMAKRVELMKQTNEILEDMLWQEGNLPTGHETTYRVELPQMALVGYNQGVKPSKSRYAKLRETCGSMMGMGRVDTRILNLQSKKAEYLASEEAGFWQAANNDFARMLMHGVEDANSGNGFNGFLTRYSYGYAYKESEKWYKDLVMERIIDAGGTGPNCASALFADWGEPTVHGIFPQGSKIGLQVKELGEQLVDDGNGGEYTAIVTQYLWDFGLVIRNPRHVVRIINIDMDKLDKDVGAGADLVTEMIKASELLDSKGGRPAIYMNKRLRTWVRIQKVNKKNANFTFDTEEGKEVARFDGIPVRRVDVMDIPEVAETKP